MADNVIFTINKKVRCSNCNGQAYYFGEKGVFEPQTSGQCGTPCDCVDGWLHHEVEVEPVEIHCGVVFVAKTDGVTEIAIDEDVRRSQ
jgi:hypothetical protein